MENTKEKIQEQSSQKTEQPKLEPIDLKLLIKNGVHFGHQTSRWSPKMKPYIWGSQNGIHLIDVSQTAHKLSQAASFLESIAAQGKSIVWVGTKKAAQGIIERVGRELNLPYVINRWVGGTFTNNVQIKKAIANLLHYEDILAKSDQFPYTKKELVVFQKNIDRLNRNVGGIRQLRWPIGAVVVVDVKKEHVCIKEALYRGIPVVALVDTNCNPDLVKYPIPGNDDVPRAIDVIMNYLAKAVSRGLVVANVKLEEQLASETSETSTLEIPGFEEEEDGDKKRRVARGVKKPVAIKKSTFTEEDAVKKEALKQKSKIHKTESPKE